MEEEPYFLELVRYIHLNPVCSGIVKDLVELARNRYTGHSVIMGQRSCDVQDVDAVLARISDKRKTAIAGYSGFVAAGLNHGRREELRGGGLIRSIGGLAAMMTRGAEERELSDERILGSGDFVESVLRDSDNSSESGKPYIDVEEVSEKSGISGEQILEPSRSRKASNARKQFFFIAHEKACATLSMLGRLTGRGHVAVRIAASSQPSMTRRITLQRLRRFPSMSWTKIPQRLSGLIRHKHSTPLSATPARAQPTDTKSSQQRSISPPFSAILRE